MRSRRRRGYPAGAWLRFGVLVVVTALLLSPVVAVVARALAPPDGPLAGLLRVAADPQARQQLGVSTLLSTATVAGCLLVGAPAGYALSRWRSRIVGAAAITVFALQALPAVLFLVPLFLLYARIGLVDTLPGLLLAYLGLSLAVAVWTMRAAVDAVPHEIEQAAWLDGCGPVRAFVLVVMPNAVPGVLTAAATTFLFTWNDYWIALVLIRSPEITPVGLGLVSSSGSPQLALLAMLPPLLVLGLLHRRITAGITGTVR